MSNRYYGARGMLNGPGHHSTAAIVAEIENTASWKEGQGRDGKPASVYSITPTIVCEISDCDRKVSIEFDIDDDDKFANSMRKADIMIGALTKLREGMINERKRYVVRLDQLPEDKRYGR